MRSTVHCTGTRALSPFNQAVLVLRWFLDATRVTQLATDMSADFRVELARSQGAMFGDDGSPT
jgi:hypothetical protein